MRNLIMACHPTKRFMPKYSTLAPVTLVLAASGLVSGCGRALPPIPISTEIRLRSNELRELVITDPSTVGAVQAFANEFRDGWGVPWYGPPVAKLTIEFYANSKFVGDFGVSPTFVTRTYGDFWSQRVSEDTIRALAGTHLAIQEAVFLEEPPEPERTELLRHWQNELGKLDSGMTWTDIDTFLKAHAIQVTYASNNRFGLGYWRNLALQTVHEGQFVNTVVTAQLLLTADSTLRRVRFFGYQHAKRLGT
jgi:hypothetical protein